MISSLTRVESDEGPNAWMELGGERRAQPDDVDQASHGPGGLLPCSQRISSILIG